MYPLDQVGKFLIGIGLGILILGILLYYAPKLPFIQALGKLPGDIRFQSKDGKFVFYAPIVSSIIISIILTVIVNLVVRLLRK
jgi:hypothetical protein